jgi:hypothetical protein
VPPAHAVKKKSIRWRNETSFGEIDDKGVRPMQQSISQPEMTITLFYSSRSLTKNRGMSQPPTGRIMHGAQHVKNNLSLYNI